MRRDPGAADLGVRFRKPALLEGSYVVVARIVDRRHGLWLLDAALMRGDQRIATASGQFVLMPANVAGDPGDNDGQD